MGATASRDPDPTLPTGAPPRGADAPHSAWPAGGGRLALATLLAPASVGAGDRAARHVGVADLAGRGAPVDRRTRPGRGGCPLLRHRHAGSSATANAWSATTPPFGRSPTSGSRVYERFERLAPAGLPGFRRGDLLARLVADVDTLQDLMVRVIPPWVSPPSSGTATVGVIWWLLPAAGLSWRWR